MPTELRRTPINGIFELLAKPFADHRGAFLNAFRAQDHAFMGSWGDRGIARLLKPTGRASIHLRDLSFESTLLIKTPK